MRDHVGHICIILFSSNIGRLVGITTREQTYGNSSASTWCLQQRR